MASRPSCRSCTSYLFCWSVTCLGQLVDSTLKYNCNGKAEYLLTGVSVRMSVLWNVRKMKGPGFATDSATGIGLLAGAKVLIFRRLFKASCFCPVRTGVLVWETWMEETAQKTEGWMGVWSNPKMHREHRMCSGPRFEPETSHILRTSTKYVVVVRGNQRYQRYADRRVYWRCWEV